MSDTGIVRLSELEPGDCEDCFVLLALRERATTRDGNPYFRATFRDRDRTATAMIWSDSPWYSPCETEWATGGFYKVRCRYNESPRYGPQIQIEQIREVTGRDAEDGFDESSFYLTSRRHPNDMFAELLQLVQDEIDDQPLRLLVTRMLTEAEEGLKQAAAAARNHHAFPGGYLEHVLSVTQTAIHLADKYVDAYPLMDPPLSKSLVVAGAILHDIGKLEELVHLPSGAEYSSRGRLVGHILLGRDMLHAAAAEQDDLDAETLLRLEHIIIAHQNRPEWGSPIAPMTPEALLVHYADDVDAKFHMMADALSANDLADEEFTSRNNQLHRAIFRGMRTKRSDDGDPPE